jgi:hypothetical protein
MLSSKIERCRFGRLQDHVRAIFSVRTSRTFQRCGLVSNARSVRLAARWCSLMVAVVAWGSYSPPSALGGCADHYVAVGSRPARTVDQLALWHTAGMNADRAEPTTPRNPAPCTGAFCSGKPATVPTVLPSLTGLAGGMWAMAAGHRLPRLSVWVRRDWSDADALPIDHTCLIFHPPRFQAGVIGC